MSALQSLASFYDESLTLFCKRNWNTQNNVVSPNQILFNQSILAVLYLHSTLSHSLFQWQLRY